MQYFLLLLIFAQKQEIDNIIIGVNQTDYSGYPDCREEFIINIEKTLNLESESNIKFHYPLINLTKSETFQLSKEEGILDIVLEESHTCYNNDHITKFDWDMVVGSIHRV